MIIRPEIASERAAVWDVHARAFGRPAEAHLVDALRSHGAIVVGLVAVEDERVVGHVVFSVVTIGDDRPAPRALGLAPLAVVPERQRQGIGSRLVEAGLAACRAGGWQAVVVLGHSSYYPRFGFMPASRYAVTCTFDVPDDGFMALELEPGALCDRGGTARYRPEFDAF